MVKKSILNNVKARLSLRPPLGAALEKIAEITDQLSRTKVPEDEKLAEGFLKAELAKAKAVAPESLEDWERAFPSLTCSIATGIGKTRLMAATIYYLHQAYGLRHFFILAPNLTLYEKLLRDFGDTGYAGYVFRGLSEYVTTPPRIVTGENYLGAGAQGLFSKESIEINIFNIAKFNSDNKASQKGGQPISPRMKRLSEYIGESYYSYLASLSDLVILMDEAHRYYAPASKKAIDELRPILGIEVTATPWNNYSDKKNAGGQSLTPAKNIIYEYNLAQALKDGLYVKIPTVATRRNFESEGLSREELDRVMLEDGLSVHQHTCTELELYAHNYEQPLIKPFVLVACRDIAHATEVVNYLESKDFYQGRYSGKVLQIDSSTKEEDDIAQQFLTLEAPENTIEIVVHVNMLGEGWDVKNLYTIIPLRAANAKTLIEQTIGRGLRLPFGGKRTGKKDIDTLTIIAHDNFNRIVEEAQKEDSLLQKDSFVELDIEKTNDGQVSIKTFEAQNTSITQYRDQLRRASTEQKKQELTTLITATEVVQAVLSQAAEQTQSASLEELVRSPENRELVVKLAQERTELIGSLFSSEIKQTITPEFVTETATKFKQNIIEIPRISVLPSEVTYGLKAFDVDFSGDSFDFRERKEEIVRQDLKSGVQEIIEVIDSGRSQMGAKTKLLLTLLNEPDLDYQVMREELVAVVNQVLTHLYSQLGDEGTALRVLDQNCQLIAKRLYEQVKEHLHVEVGGHEDAKILPFARIEPINLAERSNYPRKTLQDPPPSKTQIRLVIYHGFQKSCHECYSFDSDTERIFALVLENDDQVLRWLRPAPKQFNIMWGRESRRYEPDFVVETKDCIYLVETKADKDLSNEDVKEKTEAARLYCRLASDFTREHGGKPWEYLLISHLHVEPTFTINYIRTLSNGN